METLKELTEKKMNIPISPFIFHLDSVSMSHSFLPLVKAKALSIAVRNKLVASGLGFGHLKLAYKRDQSCGIKSLFSEPGPDNKPRITKNSLVISKINGYFEKTGL